MSELNRIALALVVFWAIIAGFHLGYGNEEDSWTAAYTAYETYSTGTYHLSRLPGHPVFEYLLSKLWLVRIIAWPILISGGAVLAAFFSFKIYQLHHPKQQNEGWLAALFLTPVMTLALGETMEYTLSLATLVIAWWFAEKKSWLGAAVLLALSTGLRLPNLIYGAPIFLLFIQRSSVSKSFSFATLSFALSALLYLPVYLKFGWGFFDTYSLPYPPLLKILYKGTVGTWGILGAVGLLICYLGFKWKEALSSLVKWTYLPYTLLLFISLGLFIALPEKSAFLLPFTLVFGMITLHFTKAKWAKVGFTLLLLNPLFLGTDLVDEYRGVPANKMDYILEAGGQKMGIKWFYLSPGTKAKNKLNTVDLIEEKLLELEEPALVVTGWWYPFLQMRDIENPSSRYDEIFGIKRKRDDIEYVYYADENIVQDAIRSGKSIFFTPEADIYNEQRYGHMLISEYGTPLFQADTTINPLN